MRDNGLVIGWMVVAVMLGFLLHMTVSMNDWHKGFAEGAAIWRNDADQCSDIKRLQP